MNDVAQILAEYGPALTSEVAARLREVGCSAEAARQRVSRLPESVRVLRGLPFPKRARFIYLKEQFGTNRYWDALVAAVMKSNPAYAASISALRSRGGVVLRKHFDIVCGAPVKQMGQLSATTILDRLIAVKLAEIIEIEGVGECVVLGREGAFGSPALASLRARLLTEGVLLDAIRSWAGRMNMASPNATRIRDDDPTPRFATFCFDLCGPCYLRPVVRRKGKQVDPGFLVADVVVDETLDEEQVAPFLRKCSMLAQLKRVRPFLPMLIADSFTPEALRACRSRGIIATRPETLFGKDVARALVELLRVLSNAAAMAASNPDKVEDLFNRLSAIEGSAGNLRGALFELLVGHMVRSVEDGSIDIGVLVQDRSNGRSAEIDVQLVKERKVKIYECKGYQPSSVVRLEEIDDWLTRCVPTIVNSHRQQSRFDGSELTFEFWTCGKFDDMALARLQSASERTRRYNIAWKDGTQVMEYAKLIKAPGIRKILNEHYFRHPLSEVPVFDSLMYDDTQILPAKRNLSDDRADSFPTPEWLTG